MPLPARTAFSFSAETHLTACAAAILRLDFLKQEKGKRVDTLQLLALMAVYSDLLSIQTTANYVLIRGKKRRKERRFPAKKVAKLDPGPLKLKEDSVSLTL